MQEPSKRTLLARPPARVPSWLSIDLPRREITVEISYDKARLVFEKMYVQRLDAHITKILPNHDMLRARPQKRVGWADVLPWRPLLRAGL